MRKIFSLFLIFIFLVSVAGVAFAQAEAKKAELERVKKYIIVLDQKIEKARVARKINKIAELKELKRKQLARAKALRAEIASLPKTKPRVVRVGKKGGFQLSAGYGGGAGILGVGYVIPLAAVDLLVGAGYGIGNKYSLINAGLAGELPLGNFYAGLEVGMANYSEKIKNVPGVSGEIDKGSRAGLGVFIGSKLGRIRAQVGYNSALGLTAGVNYKF